MTEPLAIDLDRIRKAAASHQPIDPDIIKMLPEESQDLATNAKRYIDWLLEDLQEATVLIKDFRDYVAAVDLYANQQSGDPAMFFHHLQLCLEQTKKNRST